jgi:hypothetical protein
MEWFTPDWYTVWGFWLSVAGFVLGGIGLGVTFWQALMARRAADAAREAAEQTRRESEASFRRFLAVTLHHQLHELGNLVAGLRWDLAILRCEDVAYLIEFVPEPAIASEFRLFATKFRTANPLTSKKTAWNKLLNSAKQRVADLANPFPTQGTAL